MVPKSLENYSLYLFDFDGLLVNTEFIHFKAYHKTLKSRGVCLDWDMKTYASYALFSATGLKEALFKLYPTLNSSWEELYKEKKQTYLELLKAETLDLMPGVESFLDALVQRKKKLVVVTHSPLEQIKQIRAKIPQLQCIEHWITREDYTHPKPHPEPYQTAISRYATKEDKIVGFEDSPRGLTALLETQADGVLVSSVLEPASIEHLRQKAPKAFLYLPSL